MLFRSLDWKRLQPSWLGSPKLAMYAILIVNLWQGCATPIVLLIAGLQSVPVDLYEAASIDGATAWEKFKCITIPYLIPVLNMVIVTCVKGGLTTFDYIKAMTDGGPMQSTESVGILIYNHAMQEGKFGYSVAESMIFFVIIALVSIVTMRMSNSRKVGDWYGEKQTYSEQNSVLPDSGSRSHYNPSPVLRNFDYGI